MNLEDVSDEEVQKFKLPDSLHKYAVVKMMINREFFLLERFYKKTLKEEDLTRLREYFGTDESRYPPPPLAGYSYCHYLYILISTNGKVKDIIIDKNCNRDFTDDFIYSFKPEEKEKDIDITVDLFLKGKYSRRNETIRLKTLGINDLFCKMEKRKYYYGSFSLQGKNYIINADNMFQTGVFPIGQFFVTEGGFKDVENCKWGARFMTSDYFKRLNDTTLLKMGDYDTERLTLDLEVYKCKKEYHIKGFETDYYIPNDIKIDDIDNKPFTFKDYKGKYLLIDLWGTWCGPCIETMPDLVKAYNEIDKTKIEFLSIAREDKNSTAAKDKVRKIATEKGMTWQQGFSYYINEKKQSDIVKFSYIISYPTLMLLNPEGKIIMRSEGMDDCKLFLPKVLELVGAAPEKK